MMPSSRTIPGTGLSHDSKYWSRVLDSSQKVAVYFPSAADSVTLIGYYESVSEANAASMANVNSFGIYPRVLINWWHPSISHILCGAVQHLDARVDLPTWIDAEAIR